MRQPSSAACAAAERPPGPEPTMAILNGSTIDVSRGTADMATTSSCGTPGARPGTGPAGSSRRCASGAQQARRPRLTAPTSCTRPCLFMKFETLPIAIVACSAPGVVAVLPVEALVDQAARITPRSVGAVEAGAPRFARQPARAVAFRSRARPRASSPSPATARCSFSATALSESAAPGIDASRRSAAASACSSR